MEVRGKDIQSRERNEKREASKKKRREAGQRRDQSFVSEEGKRYEYSNFTLFIRDGCLFLWGKALLVFVSSLIICMMYSTVLYSVMGER